MLSFVILLVAFGYYTNAKTTGPIVNTLNGPIKGKYYETVFGKEILAFHRIPYIKPPVGALRFKDPKPVDNWTEVLDCSLPPIPSLNKNFIISTLQVSIEGNETAIHINAYTQNLTPAKLRPVMIWIHGGGFTSDSAGTHYYAPDYLLEKDIVLFTFNYRLGVFGFLSLDDPKLQVPGNAGLKDQSMALRWIKNNCDRFGGDPNRITLFGESSGGVSVHFHALSEMSRELFNKAILMSGTVLSAGATSKNRDYGLKLAKSLGWKDDEPLERALEILQDADGAVLINTAETLVPADLELQQVQAFLPIVEPYASEQCFIPKPVSEMMIDPWSKEIPFIISSTSDEGLLMGKTENVTENISLDFIQAIVPKHLVPNNTQRKTEQLRHLYYSDEQINNNCSFINFITDALFVRSIYLVLKLRASNPSVPTYLLRFAFDSKRFNHFKIGMLQLGDTPGACHADDLSYLFKNDFYESTGGLPCDSKEYKTMKRMVDLFTNFAMSANPNDVEIDCGKWEPLKTHNLPYKCLNVGNDMEIIDWPESNRMAVWDQLYSV